MFKQPDLLLLMSVFGQAFQGIFFKASSQDDTCMTLRV